MKSIKESAEEYGMACADAELHDVANAPTLIDAYLAGAKYALERGETALLAQVDAHRTQAKFYEAEGNGDGRVDSTRIANVYQNSATAIRNLIPE